MLPVQSSDWVIQMSDRLIIFDRDAGQTVGVADVDRMRVSQRNITDNSERFLPTGELSLFAGSEPSAETAYADETERAPETQREFAERLRGTLAGTPLDVINESKDASAAALANRYQEGDIVATPDSGVGVVAGAVAEDQEAPADADLPDIEASPDSPTYVVVTEDDADRGMGLYKASDLDATDIKTEVDALDTAPETAEAAALGELSPDDSEIAELDFTMPDSWRESDTPARVIALKAFAGMGGSFDGCVREMRGEVRNVEAFCGAFLDEVLGYEAWRGDSPLPGD